MAERMAAPPARKIPWLGIVLGACLLVLGAWVTTHLEWREETTRSGYSPAARRNPYLAGMQLLQRSGYTAKRIDDAMVLDGLDPRSTLLLDSPQLFNNRSQVDKLLAWVRSGGHLVLPLNRNEEPGVLLRALGVNPQGWNTTRAAAQSVAVEGDMLLADLDDAPVFDIRGTPEWSATLLGRFEMPPATRNGASKADDALRKFHSGGTNKGADKGEEERERHAVYARWKIGQGYVTAGYLDPFRYGKIEQHDHASLFMHLMTLPRDVRPTIVALTAEYPGLGSWLVAHASEALFSLAVLLLALLWRAMPRFGPALPDLQPRRPGLLEHISAVGDFLLRQKQYEALIAPLREDVVMRLTHLRGRHPEIASLHELGAHIAGLNVRDVTLALTPAPVDARDFQQRSRTLASLRQTCNSMQKTFSLEGN